MIFPSNRVENRRIWCIYAGSDCFGHRNLPNQAENSSESLENSWEFDVFGQVRFHRFWMRGLETNPPASGCRARDLRLTVGAVGSGERRSGTVGLGGWLGGLDNPSLHCRRHDLCAFGYCLFCWKLKTENNKKIISGYCHTHKTLFICLNALVKKKKKNTKHGR